MPCRIDWILWYFDALCHIPKQRCPHGYRHGLQRMLYVQDSMILEGKSQKTDSVLSFRDHVPCLKAVCLNPWRLFLLGSSFSKPTLSNQVEPLPHSGHLHARILSTYKLFSRFSASLSSTLCIASMTHWSSVSASQGCLDEVCPCSLCFIYIGNWYTEPWKQCLALVWWSLSA